MEGNIISKLTPMKTFKIMSINIWINSNQEVLSETPHSTLTTESNSIL